MVKGIAFESDATSLAALIAVRKVFKDNKLKHAVSFHSSIKRAKDFQHLNDLANLV